MFLRSHKENETPFDSAMTDLNYLFWHIDRQKQCYLLEPNHYGIDIQSVVQRLKDNENNPEEIKKIHTEVLTALEEAKKDCIDWKTTEGKNISARATEAYHRAKNASRLVIDIDYPGSDLEEINEMKKCLRLATTYSQYEKIITKFNAIAEQHETQINALDKELKEKIARLARREKEEQEEKERVRNERDKLLETAYELIRQMRPYTSKDFVLTSIQAVCFLPLDDLKGQIKQLETDLKKYQDEQHAKEKTEEARMRLFKRGDALVDKLRRAHICQPTKFISERYAEDKNNNLLTVHVNHLAKEWERRNPLPCVMFQPKPGDKSPWWSQGMHKPGFDEDQERGQELLVYQDRSRRI